MSSSHKKNKPTFLIHTYKTIQSTFEFKYLTKQSENNWLDWFDKLNVGKV